MNGHKQQQQGRSSPESGGLEPKDETVVNAQDGAVVNASGYKDQLKRQYGLVGLAGIAVTVDNAWVALGSSISVSIGMSYAGATTFFIHLEYLTAATIPMTDLC